MSLSVQLGLLLALATAFTSVVGFLYKHRGAVESPPVEMGRPVRSSLALFGSRWYTLGIVDRDGLVGASRRRPLAGADLAGPVGDRRRPGAADGHRRPPVRAPGDPARVDRRRPRGPGARLSRRDARGRRPQRPLRATRRRGWCRGSPASRDPGAGGRRDQRRRAAGAVSFSAPRQGSSGPPPTRSIKALSGHLGDGRRERPAQPARRRHRPGVVRGPRRLGEEPSDRQGRAGDRGDQRGRERVHDRGRADRLRRAPARTPRSACSCACSPSPW